MGGRVTPGGNGGSSMSLIDDLLRPVREFCCFEVGVAVFDLGRFLNRSLQDETRMCYDFCTLNKC